MVLTTTPQKISVRNAATNESILPIPSDQMTAGDSVYKVPANTKVNLSLDSKFLKGDELSNDKKLKLKKAGASRQTDTNDEVLAALENSYAQADTTAVDGQSSPVVSDAAGAVSGDQNEAVGVVAEDENDSGALLPVLGWQAGAAALGAAAVLSNTGGGSATDNTVANSRNTISAYAKNNTGTPPTLSDYSNLGIKGVTQGNLAAINSVLASIPVTDASVDTPAKLQAIVDAYNKVLAAADGTDGNAAAAPTAGDYAAVGVTGTTDASAKLLSDMVDGLAATAVDTVAELQALADAAKAAVDYTGAAGQTAPTAEQLNAIAGGAGVTADNLAAVQAAVAAANKDGTPVTQAELAQIVADITKAAAGIGQFAQDNTGGLAGATGAAPATGDYTKAGVTGVTTGNVAAINDALASAAVDGKAADTPAEIQAIVDAYNKVLAAADGTDGNAAAAPTAGDYAAVGVTGTTDASAKLLSDVVDGLAATAVDTVAELQALADAAKAAVGYTGAAGQTAPTADQLNAIAGGAGVTADNLAAVQAAVAAANTDANGTPVTQAELQAIIKAINTPAAPTVAPSGYVDDVGTIQSTTSTAATTDDTRPGINIGTVPAGTTPALYVDGKKVAATYDAATGTLTPDVALSEGAHTFAYTINNALGGESQPSPSLAITVDITPPATPAKPASYNDNFGSVQSATSTATSTDDATPGIKIGTLSAGDTPTLYVDGVQVAATYDAATGTLTPIVALSAASHNLAYTLTDAAGNVSGKSSALALTVTVPVNTPLDLSLVSGGSGGFVINGISAVEYTGWSVSYGGDINGDGLTDLVIAARNSDFAFSNAGRTYVVYGKTNTTAVDLSAVAAGTGGFVINGQADSDFSAWSVSGIGDINGDGFADLIVGAPNSDPATGVDAGRSYVVFGKASTAAVNLSAVAAGTGGFVINGAGGTELYAGYNVSSAGDVNGDGLVDLMVNTPWGDPSAGADAGRTYVVFGKTNTTAVNVSDVVAGTGGFVINGSSAAELTGYNDTYGKVVSSAGDVNGDGFADLIIGANLSSPGGVGTAGRSYVVFGKANTTAVDLAAVATGTGGFSITGGSAGERTGYSVAGAGDVNGDGLADLLVTAPFADGSNGRAYVVFGKTNTANVNLATVLAGTGGGFVVNGTGAELLGAFAGISTAGDFNGDGLADFLVGTRLGDPSVAQADAGRTYLVFGKSDTTAVSTSSLVAGVGGFVVNGEKTVDYSGMSVSAAGDVNGDGLADLLIGAYLADSPTGVDAGRSYVVFGTTSSTGIGASTSVDQMGTAGDDHLISAGKQTLIGNAGNDTLESHGADVLYGGSGNDVFVLDTNMVTALQNGLGSGGNIGQLARIDGGTGVDTMRLSGGINLDLTQVSNSAASTPDGNSRISSVERIDLSTDTAANTLKLGLQDVLDMSGMNSFNTGNGWTNTSGAPLSAQVQRHQLVVDGSTNDVLQLVGGATAWTQAGTATSSINGTAHTYDVWNSNTAFAQVLVDHSVIIA